MFLLRKDFATADAVSRGPAFADCNRGRAGPLGVHRNAANASRALPGAAWPAHRVGALAFRARSGAASRSGQPMAMDGGH